MSVNVNTASAQELQQALARIGDMVAQLILDFRQKYGIVKREAVNLALHGNLPTQILDLMDFSEPKQNNPVERDLPSLPSVPTTNSWESVMAVNRNHRLPGRSASPEINGSRSPSSEEKPRNLPSLPSVPTTNPWEPEMAVNENEQASGRSVSPEIKGSRSRSSEEILLDLERTLAMLRRDDETTEKNELCSFRTGFMQPVDREEECCTGDATRPLPAYRHDQNIKLEENSRVSAGIKSEPGLHAAEVSEGTKNLSRSTGHKSRSPVSRSDPKSRSDEHHSRKTGDDGGKKISHHETGKQVVHQSTSRSQSRSSSRSGLRSSNGSKRRRHENSDSKSDRDRHSRHSLSRSPSRSRSHHRSKRRRFETCDIKHHRQRHSRHSRSMSQSKSPSRSRSHRNKRSRSRSRPRDRKGSKSHHNRKRSKPYGRREKSGSYDRKRSRSSDRKQESRSHRKRRSRKHSPSSESATSVDQHHRHGDPLKHPKHLRYDVQSNWFSFEKKFKSYRKVMKWTETKSKDYLIWSLEGKALDFFASSMDVDRYSFRKMMKKLETRFGVTDLKETVKVEFDNACQESEESLEDWADRAWTLATHAFADLKEKHQEQEAISKFCQGCIDKVAAKHACFERPSTMEEALDLVKYHQYISQAVDGEKTRNEDFLINSMGCLPEDCVPASSDLFLPEHRVEELIASALQQFAERLPNTVKPKELVDTKKKRAAQCFFCKKYGHIKRDCRVYQAWLNKRQARAEPERAAQCFFCEKYGHIKRDCRVYQAWLSKRQARAEPETSESSSN